MNAQELLRAGHLNEAIEALGAELREHPSDARCRLFLFELLCLAGNLDRAEKQLNILTDSDQASATGAMYYRAILAAERDRQQAAAQGEFGSHAGTSGPGIWNGTAFTQIEDADPRSAYSFEFITVGGYQRMPFSYILSVAMEPPKKLRDLIWAPAQIVFRPRPESIVDALIPVLAPGSASHPDPMIRLGRATVWETDAGGTEVPKGQRLFVTDTGEYPVLELRNLTFATTTAENSESEGSLPETGGEAHA